jgi:hypothetical protein
MLQSHEPGLVHIYLDKIASLAANASDDHKLQMDVAAVVDEAVKHF